MEENLPTLQHSGKGKIMETLKRLGVARNQGQERNDEQVDYKNFQGSETIMYEIVMVNTCLYTFIQTYRTYNTNSEL